MTHRVVRRSRDKTDPLENNIELALRPGSFIRDGACFAFVSDLEEVAAKIEALLPAHPGRAATLYESFLSGCRLKADEVDESSGSFGQFAQALITGWLKARQSSGAEPHRTAATLLAWIDDDPYGFCYGIDRDLAAAFDRSCFKAFEELSRARLESAEPSSHEHRRWAEMLRAMYSVRRDVRAFIVLAEQTGLKPGDCLTIAKLMAPRKPEEALGWLERGRALSAQQPFESTSSVYLDQLYRQLLLGLGRQEQALDSAWAQFQEFPSKFTYDELMVFVPKHDRREWREKALDAAQRADLASLLGLLMAVKETDRLAAAVRGASDADLEKLSHYTGEPAAKQLDKPHPCLAARLWRAQALRILNARKSQFYHAALADFQRAERCYKRAGLESEWDETVRRVCAAHSRKQAFIADFRALAAGVNRGKAPSFLKRAKSDWADRHLWSGS